MADYDLTRLGAAEFEQLVQALAVRVLGPAVRVYGVGPDGGRDATAREPLEVPGASQPWTGYTVIQVKFRHRPGTPQSNATWLSQQVRDEFDAWVSRARSGRPAPDNLLVATNVVLSSAGIRCRRGRVRSGPVPRPARAATISHLALRPDLPSR